MNFLQHQTGFLLEGKPMRKAAVLADGSTWDVPRGWVAADYPGHVIDAVPDLYDDTLFEVTDWTVERRGRGWAAVPTLAPKVLPATDTDIITAVDVVKAQYVDAQRQVRVNALSEMILAQLVSSNRRLTTSQLDAIPGLASAALDELEA